MEAIQYKGIIIGFIALILAPTIVLASDNGAQDYLMTLTPKGQAQMLGKAVGEGCIGKVAFYQGSVGDHTSSPQDAPILPGHEHDAIWSVKCSNGKSFSVSVHPGGDSQILDCKMLETIGGGHCFKKY